MASAARGAAPLLGDRARSAAAWAGGGAHRRLAEGCATRSAVTRRSVSSYWDQQHPEGSYACCGRSLNSYRRLISRMAPHSRRARVPSTRATQRRRAPRCAGVRMSATDAPRGAILRRAVHIDGAPPFLRRLFSFHAAAAAGAAAAAAAAATGTSQPTGASDHRRSPPPTSERSCRRIAARRPPCATRRRSRAVPPPRTTACAHSPPPPLEAAAARLDLGRRRAGVSVGAATALLVASLFLALRSVRRRIKERREAALELTRAA